MNFEFAQDGTWYMMQPGFGVLDPCYVKASVPSEAIPFGDEFPVHIVELGVRSLVPRYVDSDVFFRSAVKQVTADEVECEEIRRMLEWENRIS